MKKILKIMIFFGVSAAAITLFYLSPVTVDACASWCLDDEVACDQFASGDWNAFYTCIDNSPSYTPTIDPVLCTPNVLPSQAWNNYFDWEQDNCGGPSPSCTIPV